MLFRSGVVLGENADDPYGTPVFPAARMARAGVEGTRTWNSVMAIPADVDPATCTFVDNDGNEVAAVLHPDQFISKVPADGYKYARFTFTVDASIDNVLAFVALGIKRGEAEPVPPTPTDDALPYKAVQNDNGVYEFYGYGQLNKDLSKNPEKIQSAIAQAEKDAGMAVKSVAIDTKTGIATITVESGESYTRTFKTTGDNSDRKSVV